MNSEFGIRNCHCEPRARQSFKSVILSPVILEGRSPDRIRRSRRLSLVFSLLSLVLSTACTDYVQEIDNQYDEWKDTQAQNDSSSSSSGDTPKSSSSVVKGTLTDERDGQTYKTVTIGTQTWMAENLNYEIDGSYCYDGVDSNCTKYGRLYTWTVALESCPAGWHLPSKEEFEILLAEIGDSLAGKMLKSKDGWDNDGTGTYAYGFTALPAGYWNYAGGYYYEGRDAYFWSSTGAPGEYAIHMDLFCNNKNALLTYLYKRYGFSVRCVKDDGDATESSSSETSVSSSSKLPEPVEGTMTDSRDGQTYKTITIGSQTWMAENLNFAYIDVPYNYRGRTSDSTSWCYDNEVSNCTKYGRLYTWAAAMDSVGTWATNGKGCGNGKTCSPTIPVRGVCPVGWHLPTQTEWRMLFNTVGGSDTAGKMLKSISGWKDDEGEDNNGVDTYSFAAKPAGHRLYFGEFSGEGNYASFWSATEDTFEQTYEMSLSGDRAYLSDGFKYVGLSVRCVKDEGDDVESSSGVTQQSSSGETNVSSSSVKSSSSAASSSSEKIESSSSVTQQSSSSETSESSSSAKSSSSTALSSSEKTESSSSVTQQSSSSIALSSSTVNLESEYDEVTNTLKDLRDHNSYNTVTIGTQIWMAENLNYKTANSFCYNDSISNCYKYGRLYTWADAKTVCPSGWHLPTVEEFKTLVSAVGGSSTAGYRLKSTRLWGSAYNGTDAFGFCALPAGRRDYEYSYTGVLGYTYFWSSTECDNDDAYYLLIYFEKDGGTSFRDKRNALSVRCLKD